MSNNHLLLEIKEEDNMDTDTDERDTDEKDTHEKKWTVRELTMQNIIDIAERQKLSLEGVDILDIVSSVEKGVDAALDNWGQIIEEAIINAKRKNDAGYDVVMNNTDETIDKIKALYEEVIKIKENTPEGQKRLKEIAIELNKSNKELLSILYNNVQDAV